MPPTPADRPLAKWREWLAGKPYLVFALRLGGLWVLWQAFIALVLTPNPYFRDYWFWGNPALAHSLLWATETIVDLFGYTLNLHLADGERIFWIEGSARSLGLNNPCVGLHLWLAWGALIAAYPGPLKLKLWVIPLGWLAIHTLNVVRLVAMAFAVRFGAVEAGFDHHAVFNGVIYVLIFLGWVLWSRAAERHAQPPPSASPPVS